jgi:hypothetical protein
MRSLRTQGSGVAKVSAAGFAERLIAGGAETASFEAVGATIA